MLAPLPGAVGDPDTLAWFQTRSLDRVPQQDNHCDCGLYVLAYTEFFCDANPQAVRADRFPFVGRLECVCVGGWGWGWRAWASVTLKALRLAWH